ncbi:hypothetical protein Q4610_10360 [Sphingobium sp. HBC34]|uniref:MFS transporter n=1 Tax=Sphingobium cyanobacteriorum TaxID=3063954 RepID=A0ABT8ZMK3_9SPHN|nr:hypothetical protein [Sphingobium sp. HBC34]MDO7835446.1 hypothetical protein [Sphingobium sp. HBC34]
MSIPESPVSPPQDANIAAIAAAIALSVAGYAFYTALPMLIVAVAHARNFTDQQIGWLSSAELAGMLIGSIAAPIAIGSRLFRTCGFVSLGVLSAGLVGSLVDAGFLASVAIRLLSGCGGGFAYSIAVSYVSLSRRPIRYFGIMNAIAIFVAAAQDYVTPELIARHGLAGGLVPALAMVATALLLLPAMRIEALAPTGQEPAKKGARLAGKAWVFLAAVAVCQIAPGAFWTYVERLAQMGGVDRGTIAVTLTSGLLVSGVVCLGAERVCAWIGTHKAMIAVLALLCATMASNVLLGETVFVIRYLLFSCCWNLLIVFQLSGASELDATGRLAAMVPAAQNVGVFLGPIAGASILMHGSTVAVMLSILFAPLMVGLLIMCGVHWHSTIASRRSKPVN